MKKEFEIESTMQTYCKSTTEYTIITPSGKSVRVYKSILQDDLYSLYDVDYETDAEDLKALSEEEAEELDDFVSEL